MKKYSQTTLFFSVSLFLASFVLLYLLCLVFQHSVSVKILFTIIAVGIGIGLYFLGLKMDDVIGGNSIGFLIVVCLVIPIGVSATLVFFIWKLTSISNSIASFFFKIVSGFPWVFCCFSALLTAIITPLFYKREKKKEKTKREVESMLKRISRQRQEEEKRIKEEKIRREEQKRRREEQKRIEQENARKEVFREPFLWISFHPVVDDNLNCSIVILNSNGAEASYEVYSHKRRDIKKTDLYVVDPDYKTYQAVEKYKAEISVEGKKNLAKVFSSMPAPTSLKNELLMPDNFNYFLVCFENGKDDVFTSYSNSKSEYRNNESHNSNNNKTNNRNDEYESDSKLDKWLKIFKFDSIPSLAQLEHVYKKLCATYHPDLFKTEEEKKWAESITKDINEAHDGLKKYIEDLG